MKKTKTPKSFTPFQLNRLPKEGYWLYYQKLEEYHNLIGDAIIDFWCIKNGSVKLDGGGGWHTILWSCAPTKKGIERQEKEGDGKWYFFNSLDEMILAKETLPEIPDSFFTKAPNDF